MCLLSWAISTDLLQYFTLATHVCTAADHSSPFISTRTQTKGVPKLSDLQNGSPTTTPYGMDNVFDAPSGYDECHGLL